MSKKTYIDPTQPVHLVPVDIPKPWGKEIWYTGMEARGESRVTLDDGELPLSEYLALDPGGLADHAPVLLLKILDPAPEVVVGDLYFEVHEEKQEVYVVTHVDQTAWQDGVGGIRLGMNQTKRKAYADAHAFRAAYLEAVKDYEAIRRRIDEQGIAVSAAEEEAARANMNDFTQLQPLSVGDVVRVPTWTPHSLLHGVRVVEFQTPTYERYIISFAQKVLTQDHWDSEHAIANMHIDAPTQEPFEPVQPGIERIVRFSDFNVWRVDLKSIDALTLPKDISYAVCMGISGNTQIGDLSLAHEQACFIPHRAIPTTSISGEGTLLIAAPNL